MLSGELCLKHLKHYLFTLTCPKVINFHFPLKNKFHDSNVCLT